MSQASYLLLAVLALPLMGALLVMFVPAGEKGLARGIGLGVSILTFLVSLALLGPFDGRIATTQLVFDKEKLLSVFDTTVKAGTDPVRTQRGRLSVASEPPPAK